MIRLPLQSHRWIVGVIALLHLALRTQAAGLSIQFESGLTQIEFTNSFTVILSNKTDRPIEIWNPLTPKGYHQLTFVLPRKTNSASIINQRKISDPGFWKALNAKSQTIEIPAHRTYPIRVRFDDFAWGSRAWQGLPSPNEPNRIELIARFQAIDKSGTNNVWTGSITSQPLPVRFLAKHLRTPHEYLWNGFAHKAWGELKRDPSWITRRDEDNCMPLHIAAQFGHREIVDWLLSNGAEVNATAYNDFTALHLANHPGVVKLLLTAKADIDARSNSGTPLQMASERLIRSQIAAERRNWKAIVALLEDAARKPDLRSAITLDRIKQVNQILSEASKWNVSVVKTDHLNQAARLGREKILKLLLKEVKDPKDLENDFGYPVIVLGIRHPRVVRLLVEHGANLQSRITFRGSLAGYLPIEDNATILHHAAAYAQPESVKLLIDRGIDIFASTADVSDKDRYQTALEVAALFGNAEAGIAIIDHPRFDAENRERRQFELDRCLLITARSRGISPAPNPLKLMRALLRKGADPHTAADGATAIQWLAARINSLDESRNRQHQDMIKALLNHGAKMDLCVAAAMDDIEAAKRLIQQDASAVNSHGAQGSPALHMAVEFDRGALVRLMLQHEADIEIRNSAENAGDAGTALHQAAFYNRATISQTLIKAGAVVEARNTLGMTPLHAAALSGSYQVAKTLLDAGADASAKDDEGSTPLDTAKRSRERGAAVAMLLKQHMKK